MGIEDHFDNAMTFAFANDEQEQLDDLVKTCTAYLVDTENLNADGIRNLMLLSFAAGRSYQFSEDSIELSPKTASQLLELLLSED